MKTRTDLIMGVEVIIPRLIPRNLSKTYSKMTTAVLDSRVVVPDDTFLPTPLVRSINDLRWWGAAIFLDEHPELEDVEASLPRNEWTWRLARTSEKFVYRQNTYSNGKLMLSTQMDTNMVDRQAFIKEYFPGYKQKND